MKVFKMDEMTWVAAENKAQAIKFWLSEITEELYSEDGYPEECDINKYNSMWWPIDNFPKGYQSDFENLEAGDEYSIDGVIYGYWDGQPSKMVSYKEAHKMNNKNMPYIIAACI